MNRHHRIETTAVAVALCAALAAPQAGAQQAPPPQVVFSQERIEQLVAPIALYPDPLLAQVLTAATYPLEIVEAARWRQRNPGLSREAVEDALRDRDWAPSVQSLCLVPDVLDTMNENLEWTEDLGDAFLAQEADVMAAVQKMRNLAYEAGNLKSTAQQTVVVQDRVVVIEPAAPEVVYVPVYSPRVIYGPSWGYATYYYPSFYAPPPPGYALLSFGLGIAVGAALWADCDWGHWHGHGYYGGRGVVVNNNYYNRFNRRTHHNWHDRDWGSGHQWQHEPSHRRGANYRSADVARRYGAPAGSHRVPREAARSFRGSDRQGGGSRRGVAPPRPGGERRRTTDLGRPQRDRDRQRERVHEPGTGRGIAPGKGGQGPGRDRDNVSRPGSPPRPGRPSPPPAHPSNRPSVGKPGGTVGGPGRPANTPPSHGATRGVEKKSGPREAPRPGSTGMGTPRPPSRSSGPHNAPPGRTINSGPARQSGPRNVAPPPSPSRGAGHGPQRSPNVQRPPSGGGGGARGVSRGGAPAKGGGGGNRPTWAPGGRGR